jgi:hypothetical protein
MFTFGLIFDILFNACACALIKKSIFNLKPLFYLTTNCLYFFSNLVVDPCARYDCYGGSCTNDRGVARCVCPTGRAGNRCQGCFDFED